MVLASPADGVLPRRGKGWHPDGLATLNADWAILLLAPGGCTETPAAGRSRTKQLPIWVYLWLNTMPIVRCYC